MSHPVPAAPAASRRSSRRFLQLSDQSVLSQRMHLHGHTVAVAERAGGGLRAQGHDRRAARADSRVDVDADDPGQWLVHSHDIHHREHGMRTAPSYLT